MITSQLEIVKSINDPVSAPLTSYARVHNLQQRSTYPLTQLSPTSAKVGIGVVISLSPSGAVQILSINPAGGAAATGRVFAGDVISKVNGRSLRTIEEARTFIPGPVSSECSLLLKRTSSFGCDESVTVIVRRISTAPAVGTSQAVTPQSPTAQSNDCSLHTTANSVASLNEVNKESPAQSHPAPRDDLPSMKMENDRDMQLTPCNSATMTELRGSDLDQQKNRADELEVKYDALQQEYFKVKNELAKMNHQHEELVWLREEYNKNCLVTSIFATCFQILELSKEILGTLFGVDSWCSPSISIGGEILRSMFYFLTHNSHSWDSVNFNQITFKVHSDVRQFHTFARAIATFIYANNMMLPRTTDINHADFKVVGIEKPKCIKKYISADNRTSEHVSFEVSVLCIQTATIHKLVFTCNHHDDIFGDALDKDCYDVDILKLDSKQGLTASAPYLNKISLLDVVMRIVRKEAQFLTGPRNPHFSDLAKHLKMLKTEQFVLYDSPRIDKTNFCVFLQDSSALCLTLHGCKCNRGIQVSIEMLIPFWETRITGVPLRCPFCKESLESIETTEYERKTFPSSFDLSCIGNIPADVSRLQIESQSLVRSLGVEQEEPTDLEQLIARLESSKIVKSQFVFISKFEESSDLETDRLFFPFETSNPDLQCP
jgi:hypothetical protein